MCETTLAYRPHRCSEVYQIFMGKDVSSFCYWCCIQRACNEHNRKLA